MTTTQLAIARRAWRLARTNLCIGLSFVSVAYLFRPLPVLLGWPKDLVGLFLLVSNTTALVYGKAALLGEDVPLECRVLAGRAVSLSYVGYPSILGLMALVQMLSWTVE